MSISEPGPLANMQRDIQAKTTIDIPTNLPGLTEMTKEYLGILKDSLDVSFAQLSPGSRFKYTADSNKPMLDHPLIAVRIAIGLLEIENEAWKEVAIALRNNLPEDAKERLVYELTFSFGQREPAYQLLNNTIDYLASAIVWLSAASTPTTDKIALTRAVLNEAMPIAAFQEMILQSSLTLQLADSLLETLGRNYSQFDNLTNYLTQIGEGLTQLNYLLEGLDGGKITSENKLQFLPLANQFAVLNDIFHRTDIGDQLNILGSTINAMAVLTAALTLTEGSPSLVLGTYLASTGIGDVNSQLALFSAPFTEATQSLAIGLLAYFARGESDIAGDPGGRLFFSNAVTITLIAFATTASALATLGLGSLPRDADVDSTLQTTIALSIAYHSGVFETVFKTLADASGVPANNQDAIAEILKMIALMYAILATAQGDTTALQRLLKGMKGEIQEGIQNIQSAVTDKTNDQTIPDHLTLGLLHAEAALNDENYDQFISAYQDMLTSLGIDTDQFQNHLKTVQDLSNLFINTFTTGLEDQASSQTGVILG